MGKKRIEIVQMDSYLLYLPFYYAKSQNFFGYIDGDYEFSLASARTDTEALIKLMDIDSKINKDITFAIMDPAVILEYEKPLTPSHSPNPAVVAALLTNAAFWAIDHKKHTISQLRDLDQFDKIIAYKRGSSSYSIANYIVGNQQNKIQSVDPMQEILTLQNHKEDENLKVLALTPDILTVEQLLFENQSNYSIELEIGNTIEYSNVLVTALVTRSDVINEHRALVLGMLRAIQRAIYHVFAEDEDVINCACDSCKTIARVLNRNEPESRERVRRALKRAKDSYVFPSTIEIRKPQWLNAAKVFIEGTRGNPTDSALQQRVNDIYTQDFEPYNSLVKEALLQVINDFNGEQLTLRNILNQLGTLIKQRLNTMTRQQIGVIGGIVTIGVGVVLGLTKVECDLSEFKCEIKSPNGESPEMIDYTITVVDMKSQSLEGAKITYNFGDGNREGKPTNSSGNTQIKILAQTKSIDISVGKDDCKLKTENIQTKEYPKSKIIYLEDCSTSPPPQNRTSQSEIETFRVEVRDIGKVSIDQAEVVISHTTLRKKTVKGFIFFTKEELQAENIKIGQKVFIKITKEGYLPDENIVTISQANQTYTSVLKRP